MAAPVLPNEGLNRIIALILADISHFAVGDSATAKTVADVALNNETNRQATTVTYQLGSTGQSRALFKNTNLPSTTEEMGAFMNGSGSADSGEYTMGVVNQFVKGTADLLVVFEITAVQN